MSQTTGQTRSDADIDSIGKRLPKFILRPAHPNSGPYDSNVVNKSGPPLPISHL
jgi:hypothetical protein